MNLYAAPRYGGDHQMSAAINRTGVIYGCYSCPGLAELVWLCKVFVLFAISLLHVALLTHPTMRHRVLPIHGSALAASEC